MRHVDHHVAGLNVRVGKDLVEGVDRPTSDGEAFELGQPFLRRPRGEHWFHRVDQRLAVADPCPVCGKAFIRCQRGTTGKLAKPLELGVIADGQHDMAVRGGKNLIGHDIGMAVAEPRRRLATDQIVHRLDRQPCRLGIEHPDIDILPLAVDFARSQGRVDGDRGIHTGHEIGDGHASLHRHACGLAGHTHESAHGLDKRIVAGPFGIGSGLTKTGDRTIDEAGVVALQIVITQLVARQVPELEIFHQNVGFSGNSAYQRLAFRLGYIHGDRALVAVRRHEIGAFDGVVAVVVLQKRRTEAPRVVAAARPLDLDDFSTEIAKQLGTERPGQYSGQIEDGQAGKRPVILGHFGLPNAIVPCSTR